MSFINLAELSSSSPASTSTTSNSQSTWRTTGDEPLQSSLILVNLIPNLIIAVYFLLGIYCGRRYFTFSTVQRWVGRCRNAKRNRNGYVYVQNDEDEDDELEFEIMTRVDGQRAFTPTTDILFDADADSNAGVSVSGAEQEDEHINNDEGPSAVYDTTDDHLPGNRKGSIDLSKYFDHGTGRLREDLLRAPITAMDSICAPPSQLDYDGCTWGGYFERWVDRLVLKFQRWLEKDDGEIFNGENSDERIDRTVRGFESAGHEEETRRILLTPEEGDESESDLDEFRFQDISNPTSHQG